MPSSAIIIILALATLLALMFSILNLALRDFSRSRLHLWLKQRGQQSRRELTSGEVEDLVFSTGVLRLACNFFILILVLALFHDTQWNRWGQYLYSFLVAGVISGLFTVAIPLAIARHLAEPMIGMGLRPLSALHVMLRPAVALMRWLDKLVGHATGPQTQEHEQLDIEQQILTAVEEGEKEGVVDEQEREMIESVIEFRDATVHEVMTARPDIIAMESTTGLTIIREIIEKTGHSRIPVYEESLDHIIGVLYARDLLKYIGGSSDNFDIKKAIRQAFFVPETKPLRHLLRDFRQLKVHMAIVLDEYGGTAGLVTIEDVLEQLVGEISDEHEPQEPAMIRRIDENSWDLDARISIEEINGLLPVSIPEDPEILTLGGYVATAIGRIPEQGTVLNLPRVRCVVTEAEPQRINRLRLEITPDTTTKGQASD